MTEESGERRQFTRIAFDARSELVVNGRAIPVELVDISLRGFLIAQPEELALGLAEGDECLLQVHLDDSLMLTLPATLVRCQAHQLGFSCGALELETVTHLRRIVELNLGDQSLLDRELEHLLEPS